MRWDYLHSCEVLLDDDADQVYTGTQPLEPNTQHKRSHSIYAAKDKVEGWR